MGKEIVVADFSVKYKKYFSMEGLYKLLHEWLIEEGFTDSLGGEEYIEKLYLEKETPAGKEIWIWWETENIPFGSKYYKKKIEIKYHCLGLKSAETIYKGKKVEINSGEVEVMVTGTIETDYLNKIEKHPILGLFEKFLRERLLKKQLEAMERDFYRDLMRLQGTIKKYLGLKLWAQAADTIHPSTW